MHRRLRLSRDLGEHPVSRCPGPGNFAGCGRYGGLSTLGGLGEVGGNVVVVGTHRRGSSPLPIIVATLPMVARSAGSGAMTDPRLTQLLFSASSEPSMSH